MTRLILASGSPFRKSLLEQLGYPFEVMPSDIDESPKPDEDPVTLVNRLSLEKSAFIAEKHPEAVVIGSDTLGVCQDKILGKSHDSEGARKQLKLISGQNLSFLTSVTVTCLEQKKSETFMVPSHLKIRPLTDDAIEAYIKLAKPFDTAGSYKIDGHGPLITESFNGTDPSAVVGLPLFQLSEVLRRFDLSPI